MKSFLEKHRNTKIIITSTIKDGFVSCINPVPTICGAEMHCNKKTYNYVLSIINERQ